MSRTQFHGLVNGRRTGCNWSAVVGLRLLGCCLPTFVPVPAEALQACLPPVEIAKAEVLGVELNGALVVKGHRTARVESLLWPETGSGPVPSPLRQQLIAALKHLVGKQVALLTAAPRLDRYGRLRAQVILPDGSWLQQEILRRGQARVQIAPDRPECARELYAAEAAARRARAGLWGSPQYAIRSPESLRWRDLGRFQIVEGRVLNVKVSGRAYLNFGRNWRTDFTVTISPDDMKRFRNAAVDPYSYAGKIVRVRGVVDRMNGFEIEAESPAAIEVLQ